ncbi:2-oxo acid dehydrogenase acyltransferase [Opisthorchis viverrini]|uniref:2-oxo acid dehydrogenase acyltransferase n=1 Tax=Opisthorchis viverrini TaxID=6198 RepID=A0A1S8X1X7_OPIVI|nr:2-oxo acid dehydrogenase acyltransferase [Opisthorchis viverrini]
MTLSNQIPHFVLSAELDVAELVELRSRTAKAFMEQHGLKLTYMPFFVKFTSLSLHFCKKAAHNVGIAIDTPEGLLVPSIKSVERLSVIQIATELKRLQDLGARGKLGTDDLSGTTVTLSNIGSRLPRFGDDGTVTVGHILNVSWAADHRVIDGATVARFSNLWQSYLERPTKLILELKSATTDWESSDESRKQFLEEPPFRSDSIASDSINSGSNLIRLTTGFDSS